MTCGWLATQHNRLCDTLVVASFGWPGSQAMSAFPDSEICAPVARPRGLSRVQFVALGTALAVLGLSTIWPALLSLWSMWTTDALKSIGMVVPVVSMVLILRAWRSIGWQANGTWWGLALVLITVAVVWAREQAILILVISPHWEARDSIGRPCFPFFFFGLRTRFRADLTCLSICRCSTPRHM
jgi:hypothetical protein